jgi:hypothetical protein
VAYKLVTDDSSKVIFTSGLSVMAAIENLSTVSGNDRG